MYRRIILSAAILLVCAACMTVQNGPLNRARSALDRGDYQEALTHLLAAERYTAPTQDQKAEIVFLRGRSYEGLKNNPEAIRLYRRLTTMFPDSSYASAARERLRELEPN